jgi:hypothetical protein
MAPPTHDLKVLWAMTTQPELAVESLKDDVLHRDQFARRLARTLISEQTRKATGNVVGLAGSWGAGKSSLLNFVEEQILADYPQAIVVRFNPWLISGRNDLVREFLGELLAMLSRSKGKVPQSEALFNVLLEYGKRLSPALDFVPYGALAQGAIKAVSSALERDETLAGLRKRLLQVLATFPQPIVALIDEVDRVEDAEIHALAQLVRSIADFPNISYLLAYDATRVAEALGNGSAERGRSYLEKIIQLQIPVPILTAHEMTAVLRADLERIEDFTLPPGFVSEERYLQIEQLLVIKVLTTLRDVKRLIGTFRSVFALVQGEADWIDTLGYCALLTKAPMTAENLKKFADILADDVFADEIGRTMKGWWMIDNLFSQFLAPTEDSPGLRALLASLFAPLRGLRRNTGYYAEPLSSRYTLNAVMRLGAATDQTWLRADLVAGSRQAPQAIARELRHLEADGKLARFIDRLRDLYADLPDLDHDQLWQGISLALEPASPSWDKHYPGKVALIDGFADILMYWTGRPGQREVACAAFETLLAHGDISLVAQLLRQHAVTYGLDGDKPRGPGIWFLSPETTQAAIKSRGAAWRALHIEGKLMPRIWEPSALFIIDAAGLWDEECVKVLGESLRTNVAAFDALMVMLLGPEYGGSPKLFADDDLLKHLIPERLKVTRVYRRGTDFAAWESAVSEAVGNARNRVGYFEDAPKISTWTDVAPKVGGS